MRCAGGPAFATAVRVRPEVVEVPRAQPLLLLVRRRPAVQDTDGVVVEVPERRHDDGVGHVRVGGRRAPVAVRSRGVLAPQEAVERGIHLVALGP